MNDKSILEAGVRLSVVSRCSVVVALCLVATAACSSSGDKGDKGGGKDSIKLGLIVDPPTPGEGLQNGDLVTAGVNAAVKAINGGGGVGGHSLTVDRCVTKGNPNGAAACARQMVSDKVAAMVATVTNFGANVVPILNTANIASLGPFAAGQADLTDKKGFSFEPAAITVVPGQPNLAASLGAKKISLVVTQVPSTGQLVQLAGIGLAPYGLKINKTVQVPAGAPDMTPYVASAQSGGADAICVVLPPSDGVNFIKAAQAAGFNGTLVSDATTMLRDINSGFSSTVEGVYAVDLFKPASQTSDPAVKKMVDEIHAAGYHGVIDLTVEGAWASVQLFEQAAKGLATIDAPSILAAMPKITNFDVGIMPPVDFSKPLPMPGVHVFNPNVYYERVKDGELVPVSGKFVNLFPSGK
jgi:ABC-type branched-subunit amino acid transport system substrate-binding protein